MPFNNFIMKMKLKPLDEMRFTLFQIPEIANWNSHTNARIKTHNFLIYTQC